MRKVQEEIKRQADRRQREFEVWKKGDKVMLSTKNLVFEKRLVKKLTERYMGPYVVKEVVSKNTVKIKLLATMRIHLVVNISQVVRYREPVKGEKMEKPKPIEVNRIEEWEVEKILNKSTRVMIYLVY